MARIPAPNYTQIPNEVFDDMLVDLGKSELKVLMVIMRKTFGWHKIRDMISISQLQKYTGLTPSNVLKGIDGLVKKGLVSKKVEGSNGQQQTFYELIIDDSNNSYPSCKNSGTPPVKGVTKETPTKETISPIVPKGDIPCRKSKREEKLERASGVWTTPTQHSDLHKRCLERGITVEKCYDRLSTWKIGKGIDGGRNDYLAIVNWVMDAEFKEKTSTTRQSQDVEFAKKVIDKFPRQVQQNEIQLREKGILFSYGHINEFIEFTDFGFRDKVISRLRKMNQSVEGL